jgi:hypothetical protein
LKLLNAQTVREVSIKHHCRMNNFLKQVAAGILFIYIWGNVPVSATAPLNCTVNNLTHTYLAITDPIYDTDPESTVPYTYKLLTQNVIEATADYYYTTYKTRRQGLLTLGGPRIGVTVNSKDNTLFITIPKINEKEEQSEKTNFDLSFLLSLRCSDGAEIQMHTVVPVIDSNNHQTFFSKPKYVYNLISTHLDDFKRQLFLNPITATDYDITNGELSFNIDDNDYFDIVYGGVVPGTLNKQHSAQLIPKVPGSSITKKIEVTITVTDSGYPSNTNTSRLVINPPSPPMPVFVKPLYVGHLYKNGTFVMKENPELEEGTTYYSTSFEVSDFRHEYNFLNVRLENEQIVISSSSSKDDYEFMNHFYKNNYNAFQLIARYTDPLTKLFSTGTTVLIIELHHDL